MFLDHPTITTTISQTAADRIGRLDRADGDTMALGDVAGNPGCVDQPTPAPGVAHLS